MTEHTPTPWRVEDGTDLIWGACNPDDRSSYGMGYSIVEGKIPSWKPYKPDYDERAANAAFIVKAVNSHDMLVKVLEGIAEFCSTDATKLGAIERLTAIRNTALNILGHVGSPREQT